LRDERADGAGGWISPRRLPGFDAALFKAWATGDPLAQQKIWDRVWSVYFTACVRYLVLVTGNEAAAELEAEKALKRVFRDLKRAVGKGQRQLRKRQRSKCNRRRSA
jgi:hypothetical protein